MAGFQRIAGVDEAGRGPWAGPVVAAAVILRKTPLSVRIDDSKRLTPAARTSAYAAILDHAHVGIGIVCAEMIDRWNILRATLMAMQRAIEDLPVGADLVLVDGAQTPSTSTPCWPLVHGDQRSYVIACASIVAKVVRDRLMTFYHGLYPDYAFDQHKGYGTSLHAERLTQWGPSFIHRRSFSPVAKALHAAGPGSHSVRRGGSWQGVRSADRSARPSEACHRLADFLARPALSSLSAGHLARSKIRTSASAHPLASPTHERRYTLTFL